MTPLYRRVLGEEAWAALPAPVRALHDVTGEQRAAGLARVERGSGLVARLIGGLLHFPSAGHEVPMAVCFTPLGKGERWQRSFAGRRFASRQRQGKDGLLRETFGPVAVGLALLPDGDRLRLVVRHWSFLGVPLPKRLAPGGDTYESADGDRYRFHVEITHPLAGLIVRYQGWLTPRQLSSPARATLGRDCGPRCG